MDSNMKIHVKWRIIIILENGQCESHPLGTNQNITNRNLNVQVTLYSAVARPKFKPRQYLRSF